MRYRDYVWRPPERAYPNTQRNDPCPCGSKKKFKNCCQGKIKRDVRPWFLILVVGLVFLGALVAMIIEG